MIKPCKLPKQPLTNKASQEQVNQAVASLEAASQALDGKDSNVAALKEAMQAYDATTKTGRYANAKEKYVETTIALSKQ